MEDGEHHPEVKEVDEARALQKHYEDKVGRIRQWGVDLVIPSDKTHITGWW